MQAAFQRLGQAPLQNLVGQALDFDVELEGSDALFISTDWEEFRGLARTIQTTVTPPYLIMDGRRMIPDYDTLATAGFDYLPVGGPLLCGREADAMSGENGHRMTARPVPSHAL